RGGTAARVEIELPAGDVDEFFRTRVAHGILAAREDREKPLVAEDVPRVDERPAVDPAAEQPFHLRQKRSCPGRVPAIGGKPRLRLSDADLRAESHCGRGDFRCLRAGCRSSPRTSWAM